MLLFTNQLQSIWLLHLPPDIKEPRSTRFYSLSLSHTQTHVHKAQTQIGWNFFTTKGKYLTLFLKNEDQNINYTFKFRKIIREVEWDISLILNLILSSWLEKALFFQEQYKLQTMPTMPKKTQHCSHYLSSTHSSQTQWSENYKTVKIWVEE